MAPAGSLPPGSVFKPSGHQIIAQYLAPKVLGGDTVPGLVAECVDIFSASSPAALPFHPASRMELGEAWGYFYGAYPIDDVRPVPGGCWARYGPQKGYLHGRAGAMEAVALRRRFAFHVTRCGGDGRVSLVPTPWLMKEYRLNKGAAAARAQAYPYLGANMDCVVHKIFTKPPPPPPPCGSYEEEIASSSYPGGVNGDAGAGYSSDEDLKSVGYRLEVEEEPARKRARLRVV